MIFSDKYRKFIPFLIPLILILALGIFLATQRPWQKIKGEAIKLVDYQSQQYGFKLQYPEGMVEGKIAEDEQQKDPLMLKLVRVDPPLLVTLWQEQGLGVLNLYIKKPLLEYLKNNVDARYAKEYNDFQKEKMEDSKLAGLDAFTVWFTFQNKEKNYREKIKLTVAVKDNLGYYLQCMSPLAIWSSTEPSCDLISTNFQFLMKEAKPPSSK